jgi:hypothetical protein
MQKQLKKIEAEAEVEVIIRKEIANIIKVKKWHTNKFIQKNIAIRSILIHLLPVQIHLTVHKGNEIKM